MAGGFWQVNYQLLGWTFLALLSGNEKKNNLKSLYL
jgi:hypothetical protein